MKLVKIKIEISKRKLIEAEGITEDIIEKTCSDMGGDRRGGGQGVMRWQRLITVHPNYLAGTEKHHRMGYEGPGAAEQGKHGLFITALTSPMVICRGVSQSTSGLIFPQQGKWAMF